MICDIRKLILAYATEPVYWFSEWVNKFKYNKKYIEDNPYYSEDESDGESEACSFQISTENIKYPIHKRNWENKKYYTKLIESMPTNPRAARYLIDLIAHSDKKLRILNYGKISKNPSSLIHKYLVNNPKISYIFELSDNKTKDPRFRTYINEYIKRYILDIIKHNNKLPLYGIEVILRGGDNITNHFQQETKEFFSKEINSIDKTVRENFIRNLSTNPDGVIAILKNNKKLINYLHLNPNPNPECIELLNKNPKYITARIFSNTNPIIISMIDSILNDKKFTPDKTNNKIYRAISNMDIDEMKLVLNPAATHLIETHLNFLDCIFNVRDHDALPETITPKIVDRLIKLVGKYKRIPLSIIKCNSPHLIKLYSLYSHMIKLYEFEEIISTNEYILSENRYGLRLIDKLAGKFDF